MNICSLIKVMAKMSLDDLVMYSARRALNKRLGESFTPEQKEIVLSAIDEVVKELRDSWETRKKLQELLRTDPLDRSKGSLLKLKWPKPPEGGC